MTRRTAGLLALLATLPALGVGVLPAAAADTAPDPGTHAAHPAHDRRPAKASRAAARAAARAEKQDPLQVEISSMRPSVIPRRGPIVMTGTITNVSDETWSLINVYAFVSSSPITDTAALELSAQSDPLQPTGERIVQNDPTTFALIDELPPGATASYSLQVPHDVLSASIDGTPGVYSFGIQALGANTEGRDTLADGRARSFLPLLGRNPVPVRSAMVVPIRHEVVYGRNGSVRKLAKWARDLGPDGRLRNLLDFATGAPPGAVTWLIDPAVLEAVRRIADGNPQRDLGPASDGTDEPSPSPSESGGSTPGQEALGPSGKPIAPTDTTTRWAAEWLDRLDTLTDQPVLGLPYGDVDMAAASRLDPRTAARAQALSASTFKTLGIVYTPTVAPPSGYLDPAWVAALGTDVQVLASSAVLSDPRDDPANNPTTVTVNQHEIDLYDAAASGGGPGPTRPLDPLALRQRVLSEAALRSLGGSTQPLVVAMPADWNPGGAAGAASYFDGLAVPWLSLEPQQSVVELDPPEVPAEKLDFPDREAARELGSANFEASQRLFRIGVTVQNVLTESTTVEHDVSAQALTATSYFMRSDPTRGVVDADAAHNSLEHSLSQIHISAPPYVTLSSATGRFRIDLENGLDQQVTVWIKALVDPDLTIQAPTRGIKLEGHTSSSVLLRVDSAQLGIHQVKLVVADQDGTQLGPHADLPIRSSETGRIIWVIIGAGLVLLFGAIAVRLFRRFTGRSAGVGSA